MLRPASPVPASSPVARRAAVLECAGIADVLSKSLGSDNPINIVHATVAGLKMPGAAGGSGRPSWAAAGGRRPSRDAAGTSGGASPDG